MNDRTYTVIRLADRTIAQLDAIIARLPPRPPQREPERCQRPSCGAELSAEYRDPFSGLRWRNCTKCSNRMTSRYDAAHWARVRAARKERIDG